ncbi:MAG: hypothetical protein WCY41_05510 [Candidatus Micrarchaeia archaeon]
MARTFLMVAGKFPAIHKPMVTEVPGGRQFGKNGFLMHAIVTPAGGKRVLNEFRNMRLRPESAPNLVLPTSNRVVSSVVKTHNAVLGGKAGAIAAMQKNGIDANKIAQSAVSDAEMSISSSKAWLFLGVPVAGVAFILAVVSGVVLNPMSWLVLGIGARMAWERYVAPKNIVANGMNKGISAALENQRQEMAKSAQQKQN